jgi:predicted RNA binding protein YcfA (HicA-like mRNA interferase family)
MSDLPQVSGRRLVRALTRAGFERVHGRGSHVMLVHARDRTRVAVVPLHGGALPPGTLRAILRGARLEVDDLRALL